MEPHTLIGLAVVAYLVTRPRQEGPPPDFRPEDDDLEVGLELRGDTVRDRRQLGAGGSVPAGDFKPGQTVEVAQAPEFAVWWHRGSDWAKWAPMADGKYAPKWGAAGMPVGTTNQMPPGDVPVSTDVATRRVRAYVSDYPSAKYPRRRISEHLAGGRTRPAGGLAGLTQTRMSQWSTPALVGDSHLWAPISPDYREGAGRNWTGEYPPDGPSDAGFAGATVRRVRGLRAPGGPMVYAPDTVNYSSIAAYTSPAEKRRGETFRLMVGAQEWTVVKTRGGESESVGRAEAERRLAWVVPGRLAMVETFGHGDENLRRQITGEDGRPGGEPWSAHFYRALGTLTPSRGAEPRDGWRRIPSLALDYEVRDTAAYLNGWREFLLTIQNVVSPRRTRSGHGVSLQELDGGYRAIPPQVTGDSWARGTASQYQSTRPMIPFALEAPIILRRLVEKNYVRVIR